MVAASVTSPETHLFANRPSGKGRWDPTGLVRERQLGVNTHMSPGQYTDKAGRDIDPSLPNTLRPLLRTSLTRELSNGLVLCQPECLQQEVKTMLSYEWNSCLCFRFDDKTCGRTLSDLRITRNDK